MFERGLRSVKCGGILAVSPMTASRKLHGQQRQRTAQRGRKPNSIAVHPNPLAAPQSAHRRKRHEAPKKIGLFLIVGSGLEFSCANPQRYGRHPFSTWILAWTPPRLEFSPVSLLAGFASPSSPNESPPSNEAPLASPIAGRQPFVH